MVSGIVNVQHAATLAKVQLAAFRKVQEVQTQQAEGTLKLLRAAAQVGQTIGTKVDLLA